MAIGYKKSSLIPRIPYKLWWPHLQSNSMVSSIVGMSLKKVVIFPICLPDKLSNHSKISSSDWSAIEKVSSDVAILSILFAIALIISSAEWVSVFSLIISKSSKVSKVGYFKVT